jgi:flagellin
MTVINTNVGALMARTYATKANDKMQTSMERLSSGMRINSAADDAAGLAVANKMQSQLSGIKMAIRNSQDGISLVQTAEAGMGEVTNMILRMRELAVQMENGIYTAKDRDNAQLEVNALLAEIDKISTNTRFNDVAVLDGSYDQTIRAGNTNAETIRVAISSLKAGDAAKISAHAVEKAETFVQGSGTTAVSSANTQNELMAFEGTSVVIDTSVWSSTFKDAFKTDSLGTFTFSTAGNSDDNADFDLDAKTGTLTSKAAIVSGAGGTATSRTDTPVGLDLATAGTPASVALSQFQMEVTYTQRDGTTHVENLELNIMDKTETSLSNIEVETTAKSTRAVETLDKALEEVSSAQAKLGAIQNRLQHNIDNLSKGAMLTEQSVGRVVDADFATETSNLSKQQILNQAATAMLAQANQSKQSVLSLLQ